MAQAPTNDAGTHDPAPIRRIDPRDHVQMVKGGRYLNVAARLLWFRQENPDAILETNPHIVNESIAIFVTRIALPSGGIAVGWGSCTPQAFPDGYIEKAETKARGRALAAMGYGTPEPDEDEEGNFADAPSGGQYQAPQRTQQPQQGQGSGYGGAARGGGGGGSYGNGGNGGGYQQRAGGPNPQYLATAPQKSRIERLAGEQGIEPAELEAMIQQHTGATFATMEKRQASGMIDLLEGRRPAGNQPPPQRPNQPQQWNQQPDGDRHPITGQPMNDDEPPF